MNKEDSYLSVSGYFFAFSLCLLSFLLYDDVKIGLFLLLVSFIIFTVLIIKTLKYSGLLSPISMFVIYSFIAYPIMMLYYLIDPTKTFFAGMPIRFDYPRYEDFYFTFLYFLIGYIAFIGGFIGIKGKPKKIICPSADVSRFDANIKILPNLNILMIISLILLFAGFFLRFKLHIGLLFGHAYGDAPILGYNIVGITYFLFIHSNIFLLPIYLYTSIKKNNRIHSIIAFSLLVILAIFDTISLSKAGFIYFLFICTIVYILLGDSRKNISRTAVAIVGLSVILVIIIMFPMVRYLREISLAAGVIGLDAITMGLHNIKFNDLLNNINIGESLIALLSRIFIGFDQQLPVIAYGRQHGLLNWNDLFEYLLGNYAKGYHYWYFVDITGFGEELLGKTQHAGNLIGFLYAYFNWAGIFIGMLLWGKFNRLCYDKIRDICWHYDAYGVGLTVVYLFWFISLFQNADLFGHGVRFFIGNIILFIFWRKLLTFLSNPQIKVL